MTIENAEAIKGLFEKIENQQIVLGLYEALLELPRIPSVSIEPESHGYMSSLRIKRGNDWCFSLAPAQQWLLGYVRNPEINSGRLSLDMVEKVFPSAVKNDKSNEITVRLESFDEILRFISLIDHG